ncbi:MAG: hypothetical protein ABJG68_14375 [Crocinitomicaceae bacterium]
MKWLFSSIFLISLLSSCEEISTTDGSIAKYTYSIDSWENLGGQTIVVLDAGNPSSLDQELSFSVEAVNKSGERFIKDTSIHFSKTEKSKNFELILDTESEIEKVEVSVQEKI